MPWERPFLSTSGSLSLVCLARNELGDQCSFQNVPPPFSLLLSLLLSKPPLQFSLLLLSIFCRSILFNSLLAGNQWENSISFEKIIIYVQSAEKLMFLYLAQAPLCMFCGTLSRMVTFTAKSAPPLGSPLTHNLDQEFLV